MIDYGKPIRIFWANLLRHGISLSIEAGQLKASGKLDCLSPAYREEIIKRAPLLIELLNSESINSWSQPSDHN